MLMHRIASPSSGATRRRLLTVILAGLLCLAVQATVRADTGDVGSEPCAQCHPSEATTWQNSPHAQAQGSHDEVTCQVCHGPYVADHPQSGLMQLPIDVSCCQDCHTTTYEQWHGTGHAEAGVQCASCHVPHSQATRLAEEELCESCHREEAEHWAHHDADVHCADCHVSSPSAPPTTDVRVTGPVAAPNHNFKQVAEACVDCHGPDIHRQVEMAEVKTDRAQVSNMAESARDLAYELEDAKRTNRSLQTVSVVSLGFGLGAGGVLGVILVLIVGYVSQRSAGE